MRRFKQTQRFRLIINGISLYTTTAVIQSGLGDSTTVNEAARESIRALERIRATDEAVGLCGSWYGYSIQVSMI